MPEIIVAADYDAEMDWAVYDIRQGDDVLHTALGFETVEAAERHAAQWIVDNLGLERVPARLQGWFMR